MNDLVIDLFGYWLSLYWAGYPFWGVLCGSGILIIWLLRKSHLWSRCFGLPLIPALISLPLIFWLPEMTEYLVSRQLTLPYIHRYWFLIGVISPFVLMLLLSRYGSHLWIGMTHWLTRPFARQRDSRTDIRNVGSSLPSAMITPYNPIKFFNAKKGIFLGLDARQQASYISVDDWRESHTQVVGTTGAGKGVVAGVLLYQAIQQGEAVIVIDPKNDEYLPHVLASAAKESKVPFIFIDLQASVAQWNPIFGKSSNAIEELLTAGLNMGEKGTDADFYRLEDRRVAKQFADFCEAGSASLLEKFRDFYILHPDRISIAKKFHADLEELATTPCAQASEGFNFRQLIAEGAVIYVRGSTRSSRILKLQRIFLISILQIIESRNRASARHTIIFMDEFKYVLSKPALEALGTIRDKRAHIMIAHQSLADLKDCGGDLHPEAVIGGVVENCAIKLAYKARDADTAEWLSRLSGTILVDDETRVIERNIGLAETQNSQRMLRQAERALIDVNQLLMLPKRCAVLYGIGTAKFIFTSPIQIKSDSCLIKPQGELIEPAGTNSTSVAAGLLNVD